MKDLLVLACTLFICFAIHAQHIGINQNQPTEPLEVGGIIFTNQGGIKFPDSTIQTTAARNASVPNPQATQRSLIVLTLDTYSGDFEDVDLNISNGIVLRSAKYGTARTYDVCGPTSQNSNLIIDLTRDMDFNTAKFFQDIIQGRVIRNGNIYFLTEDMSTGDLSIHNEIALEFILLTNVNDNGEWSPQGYYEHIETIRMNPRKVAFTSYNGNQQNNFVWEMCTPNP
ncbi:MAG: hypothetical protein AAGK97_07070 [Bacteroidota bacterium]